LLGYTLLAELAFKANLLGLFWGRASAAAYQ